MEPISRGTAARRPAEMWLAEHKLVGPSEPDAPQVAIQAGCRARVVVRDNSQILRRADFKRHRINVGIVDGRVSRIDRVY